MSAPLPPVSPTEIDHTLRHHGRLWGAEQVCCDVKVEFSSRMTRSLGRAFPQRKLIRLRHDLRVQPRDILRHVLVHELAHLVAWDTCGPAIRPHGPEWRALMHQAGLKPSVTLEVQALQSESFRVNRYRHRCPVCQVSRVAYRNMRRWRCAACLEAGLSGRLEIRELA